MPAHTYRISLPGLWQACCLCLLLALGHGAHGAEAPGARLSRLIAEYGRGSAGGMASTAEIEKTILAAGRAGENAALLPLLADGRFGPLAAWSLSISPQPATGSAFITALHGASRANQVACALHAAAIGGPDVQTWLTGIATWPEAQTRDARRTIAAARMLAGDQGALTAAMQQLDGTPAPDDAADALVALADARRPQLMAVLPRFLDDRRALAGPLKSMLNGLPPATTVAEAALLAANRSAWDHCPPETGWWLVPEGCKPAFGTGQAGFDRLRKALEGKR